MRLVPAILAALATLIAGALAVSNRKDAEERFKSKYGRNTPAEELRRAEEAARASYRMTAPAQPPPKDWAEQLHRSKLGRSTPAESSNGSDGSTDTVAGEAAPAAPDRWSDNHFRAKYGRPAPGRY